MLAQFNANLERTGEHSVPIAVPGGMALDSSGYLWMADYDAGRVWRVVPSTGALAGQPIAVGQEPASVAVSGSYVWVVNAGDKTVTMINEQASPVRGKTIPISGDVGVIAGSPDNPLGQAWMPSGTQLLSALAEANCLIELAEQLTEVTAGEQVTVAFLAPRG